MDEQEKRSESCPILHILVVGFHHKKGCQVEFVYPPVGENDTESSSVELPDPWKHLPSLALPDGSHNFESDTIYFHLPSLENHRKTVFGISCYRQINARALLSKSPDVTRDTVQKSVCVLSTLPLYGMIQTKLELITHAYFEERDFSRVALLEDTYRNLNSLLKNDMLGTPQVFLGLPVRDMMLLFKHKILMLFKLVLLEKKVLFYKAPVKDLCTCVLTLCSLFPGMIESGLNEAVATGSSRYTCPELKVSADPDILNSVGEAGDPSIFKSNNNNGEESSFDRRVSKHQDNENNSGSDVCTRPNTLKGDFSDLHYNITTQHLSSPSSGANSRTSSVDSGATVIYRDASNPDGETSSIGDNDPAGQNETAEPLKDNVFDSNSTTAKGSHSGDVSLDQYGLPLQIFVKGSLCHPYLSLPFLDLLGDVSVRSFVAGATNFLFKQKKHLFDVIVEVDEAKVDIFDNDLKRQLSLTTEDLRFADHLMQHITVDTKDVFLDGTGWEGGDEWLRAQFKLYLLHLLRTCELEDEDKDLVSYNTEFVNAWKVTHNYRIWKATSHPAIFDIPQGHLFQGQLSMADMKLKISVSSVFNTERGKKINQAVNNTGKVVGGALTSAKSYVSSWWSNLNSQVQQSPSTGVLNSNSNVEMPIEQAEEAAQSTN